MKSVIIKYGLLFFWMIVIFLLSNEPATSSTVRSDIILNAVQSVDASFLQDATEFIVRKAAHFSAYFILGILLFVALHNKTRQVSRTFLIVVSIAFLYACSDEIHQLFVPGRSGQPLDVLIDTLGATVGIGLCSIIATRKTKQSRTK